MCTRIHNISKRLGHYNVIKAINKDRVDTATHLGLSPTHPGPWLDSHKGRWSETHGCRITLLNLQVRSNRLILSNETKSWQLDWTVATFVNYVHQFRLCSPTWMGKHVQRSKGLIVIKLSSRTSSVAYLARSYESVDLSSKREKMTTSERTDRYNKISQNPGILATSHHLLIDTAR